MSVCIENWIGGERVKETKIFLESVRKGRKNKRTNYGIFHSQGDLGMEEYLIFFLNYVQILIFTCSSGLCRVWIQLGLKIQVH